MFEPKLQEPLSGEFNRHHRKNPLPVSLKTDFGSFIPSTYQPPSTSTPTNASTQHKSSLPHPLDVRDDVGIGGGDCRKMNCYIQDDQAFHDLVTSMLSQLEIRKISPEQILMESMSQAERSAFREALTIRMSNLPTFPESREDRITFLTRKADGVFRGPLRNLCTKFTKACRSPVEDKHGGDLNSSRESNYMHQQPVSDRQVTPPKQRSDAYSSRASYEKANRKNGNDASPRRFYVNAEGHFEDNIYRSSCADGEDGKPSIVMNVDRPESPMSSVTHDIIPTKDTDSTSFTHDRRSMQNDHQNVLTRETDLVYSKRSLPPTATGTDGDPCKTPLHCPAKTIKSPISPLSSSTGDFENTVKAKETTMNWDEETKRWDNKKRPRIRQKLIREIQKASQVVRSTADPAERATYGRYLKHLNGELELWIDSEDEQSKSLEQNLEKEMLHAANIVQTTGDPDERGLYERYLGYLREERKIRNEESRSTVPRGINPLDTSLVSKTRGIDTNPQPLPVSAEKIEIEIPPSVKLGEDHEARVPYKRSRSFTRNKPIPKPASPQGPRVVNVVAPENLPEHFTFEARIDDEIFLAVVPEGGVEKGQVFPSMMYDIDDDRGEREPNRVKTFKDMATPENMWRDDLFDCIGDGCCHPMLLNTIFCPVVALSQIMARMQLNALGRKAVTLNSRTSTKTTIFVMVCTLLAHLIYLYPLIRPPTMIVYLVSLIPLVLLDVGLLIHFYRMMILTRRTIREEYEIPNFCTKREDVFVSVCCTCCALSQMGRHTADYETYRPFCCSDTGLPNHIEVKLPSDTPGGFSIGDPAAGRNRNGSGIV